MCFDSDTRTSVARAPANEIKIAACSFPLERNKIMHASLIDALIESNTDYNNYCLNDTLGYTAYRL